MQKSTTNYSRFVSMKGNRPINQKAVKDLTTWVAEKNKLHLYPIVCRKKTNGMLEILDGQHRFIVAKSLKLPVHYVIDDDKDCDIVSVAKTNSRQLKWSPSAYVNAFANAGYDAYSTVKKFMNDTGFSAKVAARLVHGDPLADNGGNVRFNEKFTNGEIKIGDLDYAYRVAKIVNHLKKYVGWGAQRSVVLAVAQLCKLKPSVFDENRFFKKLEKHSSLMDKKADLWQYLDMFEKVYNYKSRKSDMVSLVMAVKKL